MSYKNYIRYWLRRLREDGDNYYDINALYVHKAIFVHVPKTGGVSVSKSLFGCLAGGHSTVSDYINIFGQSTFDNYFKFGFVRQPYDRFFSAINYLIGGGMSTGDIEWRSKYIDTNFDINSFILEDLAGHMITKYQFMPQSHFLLDKNREVPIDFLGRFETIREDFEYIANILGTSAVLRHENKSSVKKYRLQDISAEARIFLGELYKEDFDLFGY